MKVETTGVTYLVKCTPMFDSTGTISTIVHVATDISEIKKAENALRQSEEKYRILIENSAQVIFIAQENRIKFSNPKGYSFIGYTPEELSKIPYIELVHPDFREMVMEQTRKRLSHENVPSTSTLKIITKKKDERWVEWTSVLIEWEGRPATVNFINDLTERHERDVKLRHFQKLEAVGTLAGGIAHEFNNILAIILGNAELAMIDLPDENPVHKFIEEIRSASLRGKDVVKQMLRFAKPTPVERKPFRIASVIKEALRFVRTAIPAQVEIRSKISCGSEVILADPIEIHQIVFNLIRNSVEAINPLPGFVEVCLEPIIVSPDSVDRYEGISPGHFVKMSVIDNGKGVTPEILHRIFDPYFTTKEFGTGVGMGLTVVYGIIKSHNGAIRIDSEYGKGTTVEILFPLQKGIEGEEFA
jgi:PAS domain S-box-containing protein